MSSLVTIAKDHFFSLAAHLPQKLLPTAVKLRLLARSGVLDHAWYCQVTKRSPATLLELAEEVWNDDRERVANPLFSADSYRHEYHFKGSPGEALLHYVLVGEKRGFKPCEWFDPVFFRRQHPEIPESRCALAVYNAEWISFPSAHPYFDGPWYLTRYQDVAASGINPLAHFINYGSREGREPNAYFDAVWYLDRNQDIAKSGMTAALHFCRYGAMELRNPGPDFDMNRYASKFPEYALTGLDPLAHYLVHGRRLGHDISRMYLSIDDFEVAGASELALEGCVDIIIPVYRNLVETRRCIESVLASSNTVRTRLRLINDFSPEPEVTAYLRELAAKGGVLLDENANNLGFVRTVNRGMRAALACADCSAVILLNSDTEVAGDWVDRIYSHILRQPGAGTVAALSNNATICSYPKLGENEMPPGRTVADVDRIASKVNCGVAVEIPTSVGFCMLISRTCLETVGLFDEEAFGRGYGEENDFSLRAVASGFTHLLATDVFVKHVGEVSFAETSSEGKRNSTRIILERYPDYNQIVARHVGLDPALVARLRLTFALWKSDGKPVLALVTHNVGGGTERQVGETCRSLESSHHVVVIKPAAGSLTKLYLENRSGFDGFDLSINIANGLQFAQLLKIIGVDSVQVHHLLGHGPNVRSGLAIAGLEFEFHLHDYHTLCPQITMTDERHEYCGEPDAHGCNACIAKRPALGATDIVNWRLHHEWAVLGASRVVAPSRDTAARMQRYYNVPSEVRYHECLPTVPVPVARSRAVSRTHPLRIVMIGVLAEHKGKHKVLDAIAAAAAADLPLHFHVVGYLGLTEGQMTEEMAARFSSTGWYKEQNLARLIEESDADVFLFASTAPETYSFTLTSAMKTGRPIVAPAHGAYTERLESYVESLLFPVEISGSDLAGLLMEFAVAASRKEPSAHADD